MNLGKNLKNEIDRVLNKPSYDPGSRIQPLAIVRPLGWQSYKEINDVLCNKLRRIVGTIHTEISQNIE